MSSNSGNSHPPFEPPSGGDLILKSSDGIQFRVHSVILKLASPAFDGMIVVGTTKDVVELSENSTSISLILKFIYPSEKTPIMTNFDMATDCLHVAQKYDMQSIIKNLDEQIASNMLPHALLASDPMHAHQLAVQFGLSSTKVAAAPLVAINQLDVCDPHAIPELARKYSPSSLIRMIGLQGARAKIIASVLFSFDKAPMLPASSTLYFDLSCSTCQKSRQENDIYAQTPPSWVLGWAQVSYDYLLLTSLEDAAALFEASVLLTFEGATNVCQKCFIELLRSSNRRPRFEQWADGVRKVLKERLATLELLYAL